MHRTFTPDSIGEADRQIWALHQTPVDNVAVRLNTVCMYLVPH